MTAPVVELRSLRPEDRDRLLAWRNAPEVSAYMYSDHEITPEEHARWFYGVAGDARRAYWIIEMDGAPVGLANLYDIDRTHRRCAWAYYLAEPQVRGRGVGSYVEYVMIEKVFGEFGLNKLWCEVLASNEAVWKLHERFGFRQEARLRDHVIKHGAAQDVLGLGLLKADWLERRGAMAEQLAAKGYALVE
jgi:UDP-4-amino-4,6-dideoxy-N-acetyl-beta-L-altrosamine N-acetyltransferase